MNEKNPPPKPKSIRTSKNDEIIQVSQALEPKPSVRTKKTKRTKITKSKESILQFTIIDNSGSIVYHKAFVDIGLDSVLLSGFSAAILAFARELGTELYCIQMLELNYFFKSLNPLSFVACMKPYVEPKDVNTFMKRLVNKMKNVNLEDMISSDLYYLTQEFQTIVNKELDTFRKTLEKNIEKEQQKQK